MKNIYTLLLSAAFLIVSFSAKSQTAHHEITKLDDHVELLLDSAAKHMVLFILKQDEKHYGTSMSYVGQADSLNKILQDKLAHNKEANTTEMKSEMQERSEELQTYYNTDLKGSVMKESKESRKTKYKFHGQTYLVSAKSKAQVDQFVPFLPAN